MIAELVPAEPWHLRYVADHARPEDVEEIRASCGTGVLEAMEFGLRFGLLCRAALVDGVPACVFGVTASSLLGGVGAPWMIATPEVERQPRALVALSRPVVAEMAGLFPLLVNFVDNRNRKAHRWLAWLGFQLDPPAPHGVDQLPFRRFTMETP